MILLKIDLKRLQVNKLSKLQFFTILYFLENNLLDETDCNLIDKNNEYTNNLFVNKKLLGISTLGQDHDNFGKTINQNENEFVKRDSFSDEHLKYLNKLKPMVIDFDNDDWIYNPNLCEIERYEIDKMSNYSETSENCEYSLDQSQNEEENRCEFENYVNINDDTKSEINDKVEEEFIK